ncbi:MAG TPA: DUF1259 domain-containing protein [Humisphaera sp.]|nr:DUF1259 domain-containing protein [Humisphaera sp.]
MVAIACALTGCAAETPVIQSPTSAPATTPSSDPAWPQISKTLNHEGVIRDNVYTISIPRDDLDVNIEGMDVPTAAGLESVFWFYRCPCGKLNLVGQFLVADYEANDVIDALRAGRIKVASVSPYLLYEKPRLLLIRFQDEGDPVAMAETLREALRWMGKARMPARKLN